MIPTIAIIISKAASGESVLNSEWNVLVFFVVSALLILVFFLLITYGWKVDERIYSDEIEKIGFVEHARGRDTFMSELSEYTGVVAVFENMDGCLEDIRGQISSSKNVSICVQIGRDLLSGKGLFYEQLKSNRHAESVRILHSGKGSPYLSEKKAKKRSPDKLVEWHDDLTYVQRVGENLSRNFNDVVEIRTHKEGYYWRLFLFDDVGYVQPYIYNSKNSVKAPVFKVENSENSIYATFHAFFDNKWKENDPKINSLSDLISKNENVSVTALAKHQDRFVFVAPIRYVYEDQIHIQAPGGKIDEGESFSKGLSREIFEEIGCKTRIHSSSHTVYAHEGTYINTWKLNDRPAPSCVSKRDLQKPKRDKNVEWVLLFHAELHITTLAELVPKNEMFAVVCLTSSLLSKLVFSNTDLKVSDVLNAKDGSEIISNQEVDGDLKLSLIHI